MKRHDIRDALKDVDCCDEKGLGPSGRCRKKKDFNPYTSPHRDDEDKDKDVEPWFVQVYARLMLLRYKGRFMDKYNDTCLNNQGGYGGNGNRGNDRDEMPFDDKRHILQ